MGQVPITGYHSHKYANNDVYQGNWSNSQRNDPNATLDFANGDKYRGGFLNDQLHGEGTMSYNNNPTNETKITNLPSYVPTDPHSFRNRVWLRTQHWTQQQEQQANVYMGTYDGFFLSNKRNAFGQFSYSNKDFYFGEWQQDMRCGIGTLLTSSYDEYEGLFKDNAMHGWGIIKFNCLDRASTNQSIVMRKHVLKYQVMAHLYQHTLKQPLPKQYKLPLTFLMDGNADHTATLNHSSSLSSSTGTTLSSSSATTTNGYVSSLNQSNSSIKTVTSENKNNNNNNTNNNGKAPTTNTPQYSTITIADIDAFIKPSQSIQQTQLIPQLMEYTIQSLQSKQFKLQKYDSLVFITHEIEVEGFWVANQLSGPLVQNNEQDKSISNKPNLDGFVIIRKFTLLNDDNSQQLYQLQQELQQKYHSNNTNTKAAADGDDDANNTNDNTLNRYGMIMTQQLLQYFVDIRIVPVQIARRVVETYGKIDLDVLATEISEEMNIADDEFDDVGLNTSIDYTNTTQNTHTSSLLSQSTPQIKRDGKKDASNMNKLGNDNELDRQLEALSSPIKKQQQQHQPLHHSTPHIAQPSAYDDQPDFHSAYAPQIHLDGDYDGDNNDDNNENNNGTFQISLDDDDNDGNNNENLLQNTAIKAVQDAVSRVEALFGDDQGNDDFAIGDDDDDEGNNNNNDE